MVIIIIILIVVNIIVIDIDMPKVQASCEQAMKLWWEDFHPGWMIFTLGNQHFETLHQIIQYSQSSIIKGGLTHLQVRISLDFCISTSWGP